MANWAKLTQDQWILSTIQGYHLPLVSWPHRWLLSSRLDDSKPSALQTEVQKLIEKGAAVRVQPSQVHVSSPMFIVPKSGGGCRPIIDLRFLNTYLEPPHFKVEGLYMLPVILKQDWFMAKIDLKDAYLTIPVAAVHHPLLSFQVLAGEWIQFQCLPFGLCTAPFVFSKVTKPLVQFLRQLGIYLIIYLDDLLIASPGKPQLLEDLSTVFWLFTALGFLINLPKSITEPTQSIEFLGFVIDSAQMTVTLPPHKVESIQKEASQILTLETVQIKTLGHLIGTLVATKPAIPLAPLHFRSLQDLKVQTLRCHKASYHTTVHLSQEAQRDLQWWATQLPTHCSNSIVKTEASVVIESDASKSGWGAICQGVSTGGKWTAGEAASHINYLELTAAFLALQSFTKDLNNVGVLIRMDNRTAIAQINKMGGLTLSPPFPIVF